ncbi:MAG: hypothetical protein AUH29_17605 [Candidatus Rokubacteria bacterium 13_1_40CM_69_27]|nr:MAG: hypothetical protein AUH29_17605 [Candidatus Rokubacteria bacterium 13_1_40CM_69_27]OLC36976.1 MAG: hypothetical protein AUH81_07385 [Candidatus Rokubacteria bacterium 13_1_40CM_4_69_5]
MALSARANVLVPVVGGVEWGLDRMVTVGYGVVYDYIFERFEPYRALQQEVLGLLETLVPDGVPRRSFRVLELACGPGNFSCLLSAAGFSVVGMDPYGTLIELAREKRRAHRLGNLAFWHADLAEGKTLREGVFDAIVDVHSLYAHPAPHQKLGEAFRVLKSGGHAIFVNHTRRVGLCSTFAETRRREGWAAALGCLRWVVPNAVFEAARKPVGPHYWSEDQFASALRKAGFTVLEMRRTFLHGASLLAWARKDGV